MQGHQHDRRRMYQCCLIMASVNPFFANGFPHPYQLDESTFILGTSGVILKFYSIFDEIPNRIATGGTPRSVTSHMGLKGRQA